MSLIWAAIKKSRNLTGLKQTFMATTTTEIRTALRATGLSGSELVRQTNLEVEKSKVTVDAVVSKGVEWIKLINMNEQRLLFEMAANGWDFDSESESESESKDQSWPNSVNLTAEIKSTGNDRLSIVRHAKMLARASQSNPCRYRIPTVRIVLPRITAGKVKEIDKVLDMARNAGPNIILETAESDFVAGKSLSLGTVLSRLMVDESEDLTTTVNLDTSILVALMSDITHSAIPDQPWYSKATTQQIIDEQKDPGAMTRALYPALQGRDLARLDALFSAFKALSSHVVPDDLRLPIKIVNFNIEQAFETGLIPEAARSVISELRDITCSTFTYGWISRTTTISCNKQLTSIFVV
ncbi:hypothetical protein CFO_g3348 [Ceratocystis platani]|uniref:Uncharacterized protein n=1 Tax=Ceratocystis fimbriata f. sp. platani TaxID=88771 RepID=A0A0F8B0A4_CERFI|nr:hypothetical protein CFO_g3348 [Ceratocystis platani]